MALKPDRHIVEDDIYYLCNDVTERGVFLIYSGSGDSGVAYDSTLNYVKVPGLGSANLSGVKVAGLLMHDLVNNDETRNHVNWHKEEQQIGRPVRLGKRGTVWTDRLSGTPGAGDTAYLAGSGYVSPTDLSANGSVPTVGKFKGRKDSDGFVRLAFDIN